MKILREEFEFIFSYNSNILLNIFLVLSLRSDKKEDIDIDLIYRYI